MVDPTPTEPPTATAEFAGAVDELAERGWTLAVAESLTGGELTARFVEVPGSGEVVLGGVVAYAREVKHGLFGIDPEAVVCPEAATAMATGVRRRLGADIGVGLTGVAGPATQDGQPVGTVYAAVSGPDDRQPAAVHRRFDGAPEVVRSKAAHWAAALVRDRVAAAPPPSHPPRGDGPGDD